MTVYLTEKQIEHFNELVIKKYSPKENIQVLSPSALNMIVNLPEQFVFGKQLYPTLFDKAIILFVQLVKKHIFANANKRTAFLSLVKFLELNGYKLNVRQNEAVNFTVEVAVKPITDDNLSRYKEWLLERVAPL